MSDLLKRLPTTVFLLLFAYVSIRYLPLPFFSLLLYIIISLAAIEFIKLTRPAIHSLLSVLLNGALIGVYFTFPGFDLKWMLFLNVVLLGLYFLLFVKHSEQLQYFVRDFGIQALAIFYLYLPLFFMLELKKKGPSFLFFLIAVIAIGDSGAYFVGRAIGKHKIYPIASPKKSLEGLLAALVTAALSGYLLLWPFPITHDLGLAIASAVIIGLFSQLSDPIESLFKRAAGVKDSSNLLPGHGGILDRLDSYIFCAPVFAFIVNYFWK